MHQSLQPMYHTQLVVDLVKMLPVSAQLVLLGVKLLIFHLSAL
ncbi:hypothetical protein Goshw_000770 [Gossypium schwendimanii]|uniref:Uncharacterized protein n=1 Tax=Gossypium schwendimanii TaxID=34291 RepID=A0A7J9KQ07_GOSSC|nr:hypothetical protein [Gossypium schwendimanii]